MKLCELINTDQHSTNLIYLGQAGFIIKSKSGELLGIDLYMSDCVERIEGHVGFKRLLPKITNIDDVCLNILIATHPHWDHFDVDSVPILLRNKNTVLFASYNCEQYVDDVFGENSACVEYVKSGDIKEIGDFHIRFIRCDHGQSAPDAVGVLITVDNKTVLFTGDTSLRLDYLEDYLSEEKVDYLIGPINGKNGNMNETELIELADNIKPGFVIPSHYGMFSSHGGNLDKFYEIAVGTGQGFIIMAFGESISI